MSISIRKSLCHFKTACFQKVSMKLAFYNTMHKNVRIVKNTYAVIKKMYDTYLEKVTIYSKKCSKHVL